MTNIAESALTGWRAKAANALQGPISQRTPLAEEHVRAAVAAVLFGLSVYYVVGTVKRAADAARS